MNRLLLLFFSAFFTAGYAQENTNIIGNSLFSCSYFGDELKGRVKGMEPKDSAYVIIMSIVDLVGLKPNFEIRSASIPNVAAVVYKGKRYLLYNNHFISQVNKQSGNKWAAVTILAHEVGH